MINKVRFRKIWKEEKEEVGIGEDEKIVKKIIRNKCE